MTRPAFEELCNQYPIVREGLIKHHFAALPHKTGELASWLGPGVCSLLRSAGSLLGPGVCSLPRSSDTGGGMLPSVASDGVLSAKLDLMAKNNEANAREVAEVEQPHARTLHQICLAEEALGLMYTGVGAPFQFDLWPEGYHGFFPCMTPEHAHSVTRVLLHRG
ncbi:hypothetical protein CYMTET_27911 [Cymbomonas tetramitiformis]|uniref:Uncharacterized protein n=1 Tax=Cymbomonas tetramitiformis TaxID=36881 RepID=A0AAE0FP60_9CHLO|nr:hypothetical protein CYMTET_27911 [Cymbomonas tetramitiformis]